MTCRTLVLLAVLALAPPTLGQEPTSENAALPLPECDIFLFEFSENDHGVGVARPRNITNRKGYDNQPWFTPASKTILFSANRSPDRTDVYEFEIATGKTTQVTDTPTQEYSPQSSPDNKTVSFVTDGKTANQSIWFARRDSGKESWLLANQGEREPVGYYSWNRRTGYILFWSRYGFSLRLVHKDRELSHYVTGNAPPTTPYIIPGTDKFSFAHRQGNGETWIKELDPETKSIRPLTPIVGNNNNYGWTPQGRILMADGTKLHAWSESQDEWKLVTDLASHGLKSVTRVAVSPNGKWLAVVALPATDDE